MKLKERKGALLLLAAVGEWLMKSIMKQQSEKKATSGAPSCLQQRGKPIISFNSSLFVKEKKDEMNGKRVAGGRTANSFIQKDSFYFSFFIPE